MAEKVQVSVAGRSLSLSNLDKVLYPDMGFTKGEVIDYYTRVADVLLPHLAGRALTVIRFPNGIEGHSFFEKNAPKSTPDWVRTVTLPAPGSTKNRATIDYIVVEELATLVWLANLAALEMHVHQWQVDADGAALPADQLVVDLDPGRASGTGRMRRGRPAAARPADRGRVHAGGQDLGFQGDAAHRTDQADRFRCGLRIPA